MPEASTPNAWILRLDHRLEHCLANGYVAVGWCRATQAKSAESWEGFKAVVQEYYGYESNQALGNAAGSFWRFLFEIGEGDTVIIPVRGAFHVGKVVSDSLFNKNSQIGDSNWQRKVEWRNGGASIRRSFVSNGLQRRLRARQTCVEASEFVEEVELALTRTKPLGFVSEVRSKVANSVADVVDEVVGNRALERLIMALAKASGFDAKILPRRQPHEGDIDVLATKALPAPAGALGGDSLITVGYQVKRHEEETDAYGLDQILAAVESGAADYGVLVTSAERFSQDVIQKVEGSKSCGDDDLNEDRYKRIWLISREQLAEWILDVGLEQIDRQFTID